MSFTQLGFTISLIGLFGLSTPTYAQVNHRPAKMITEHQGTVSDNGSERIVKDIKTRFIRAHNKAGKPRLAVFWNRKLDDQLSQWYTGSRNINTYENWWKGKGFSATQKRIDVESRFDNRPQPSELAGFEFDSGFTRTLLGTGITIVDRDSIMRLTHSKEKEAANKIIVADYQQIEIDALKGYADLIAEVLYANDGKSGSEPIFMITVKKVATGEIITKFRSRPYKFGRHFEDKWITTENGYEKVSVEVVDKNAAYLEDNIDPDSAEYVGWSVALQTMQALTKYWG